MVEAQPEAVLQVEVERRGRRGGGDSHGGVLMYWGSRGSGGRSEKALMITVNYITCSVSAWL